MTKARAIGLAVILALLLLLYYIVIPAIQQHVTRKYGGSFTVNVPAGFKVEGATWGADNLWYFVRNPTTGQTMLVEDSRFGGLQGRVIFNEQAD